jgi:putative hydrolase of the HAD superfamily
VTSPLFRRPRAVLFDLDDTLFDHVRATRVALADLRDQEPALGCWSLDEFDRRHRVVLERWHQEVLGGRATIETARISRFRELLEASGGDTDASRASVLAARYRSTYETAWFTVPGAREVIDRLIALEIPIGIVTNNVLVEQRLKLERCALTSCVATLVTSEEIGVQKPDPRIFEAALARLGTSAGETVMVGDAWATDIEGALRAGIRPVWINRFGEDHADARVSMLTSFEPVETAVSVILGGPDLQVRPRHRA